MPQIDTFDLHKELAELSLSALAEVRRKRKKQAAEREAATADARATLAAIDGPLETDAKVLEAQEAAAKEQAVEALVDFAELRKARLLAGIESPNVSPPEGVTVSWGDVPVVRNPEALPAFYQVVKPNMARIKTALKSGQVDGVTLERRPTVRVEGEE